MARIRTVKPELWTSPGIVRLDPFARLLYIGSWNFADDHGLLPDDPERLRLQVLPADNIDANHLVDTLCTSGHYVRVVAPNGDRLLSIPTFSTHQRIDKRTAGKWGDPATWGTDSAQFPTGPAASPPIPTYPHPGMEGNGMDLSSARDPAPSTQPVDNELIERVAAAVAQHRLEHQTDVRNASAWKRTCLKNLRADSAWWTELERIVAKWPTAPIAMLAAAAEGDISPHLNHYRTDALAS
jgi:hypothetical protein